MKVYNELDLTKEEFSLLIKKNGSVSYKKSIFTKVVVFTLYNFNLNSKLLELIIAILTIPFLPFKRYRRVYLCVYWVVFVDKYAVNFKIDDKSVQFYLGKSLETRR